MSDRPNLLLVVMDTVRAASVEPYGCAAPSSPFLRRFAASACTYERAHATSCWTLPSHASIFTGLPTEAHRVGDDRDGLHELDTPVLAERLRARGYATVAASANPWVGPSFGFDRGFDHFIAGWRVGALPDVTAEALITGESHPADRMRAIAAAGPAAVAAAVPAAVLARRRRFGHTGSDRLRRRFLRAFAAASDRPVFGFVNLLDAHLPRRPPRRHREAVGAPLTRAPHPWEYVGGIAPPPDRSALTLQYLAAVRHADEQVGRLITAVDRIARRPTMVVITSDHGENVCEHGLMDHQFSLHQTLLHVPLLVRDPDGARAGERESGLTSLADLHAILLDGTPPPRHEAVTATYARPQPPVERLRRRHPRGSFDRLDRSLRAWVHSDGRKLIWASDGRHEAYDLTTDPGERHNLWPARAFEDALTALEPADRVATPGAVDHAADDRETAAALRALGYL